MAEPRHFSIVVIDIERSGDLTDPQKQQVRDDLYRIVDSALLESEIVAKAAVIPEDRGDGVYLLIKADVPIRRLIHPFIGVIDAALAARLVGDPKLRLRLVVHHGEVTIDAKGSSGAAADLAFAMVDCRQLRDALTDATTGRLAAVVPDDVYQSVVRGYAEPDPTAFRMRLLETKRGSVRTWVTVTGSTEQPGGMRQVDDPLPQRSTQAAVPSFNVHNGDEWNIQRANNRGQMGTANGNVTFGVRRQEAGDS
jgi:hypothetical protein